MNVYDHEIVIKNLVTKDVQVINFTDIRKIKTNRPSYREGDYNESYEGLEMELIDGSLISFDEEQYENYREIKARLIQHDYG